jgi:AcrR family transcriptional regulator
MARIPADVRRQELVEAAIRVMARDGIAKATTRAIVDEAEMNLGFFHYCFRSKEELLVTVITTINDRNQQAAMAVVTPHRGLRDTLTASFRAYWDGVERNPGEHQVTYELTQYALRHAGLAEVARVQYDSYVRGLIQYLQEAAAANHMEWTTPVEVLAHYAHSVLDGVTLAWVVDRDSAAADAVLHEAAQHIAKQARRRRDAAPDILAAP